MNAHGLHHHGWAGAPAPDGESKWQRHVMVLLWIALTVFLLAAAGLFHAKNNGFFHHGDDSGTSTLSWPETLP
jgi:hypothetical protein